MKKRIISCMLAVIMVISVTGCSGGKKEKVTTYGDLKKKGWQVEVPEGALEKNTELEITELKGQEGVISSPIDIKVKGQEKGVRLDKPVKVIFQVKDEITDDNIDNFVAGYDIDGQWEPILPNVERLQKGYLEFETYHFSSYGYTRMDDKKQVELYARKAATYQTSKESSSQSLSEMATNALKKGYAAIGISDETIQGRLVHEALSENDWGALLVSAERGDLSTFAGKLGEMAANTVLNCLDEDGALNFLDGKYMVGDAVAGAVNGYSAFKKGNFKEGMTEIAKAYAENIPGVSMVKVASEVTKLGVQLWKDQGVENAYKVYSGQVPDGSYGYHNVESFDELVQQMKGLAAKITDDAKNEYCKVNSKTITRKQLDKDKELCSDIERGALAVLKKQFDARKKSDELIEARTQEYELAIKYFKEKGLFTRGIFFPHDTDINQWLDILFCARRNVLKILGDNVSKLGKTPEEREDLIAQYVRTWVTEDNVVKGREKVIERMVNLRHLDKAKTKKPSSKGTGKGHWKLTEVIEVDESQTSMGEKITSPYEEKKPADGTVYTWNGSGGNYSFSYRILYNHTDVYGHENKADCANEYCNFKCIIEKPKDTYEAGEKISLGVSIEAKKSQWYCWNAFCNAGAFITGVNPNKDQPFAAWGNETSLVSPDGIKFDVTTDHGHHEGSIDGVKGKVEGEMITGEKEGDITYIVANAYSSGSLRTAYKYVWVID